MKLSSAEKGPRPASALLVRFLSLFLSHTRPCLAFASLKLKAPRCRRVESLRKVRSRLSLARWQRTRHAAARTFVAVFKTSRLPLQSCGRAKGERNCISAFSVAKSPLSTKGSRKSSGTFPDARLFTPDHNLCMDVGDIMKALIVDGRDPHTHTHIRVYYCFRIYIYTHL